jgi:antirestriction protein ArdC
MPGRIQWSKQVKRDLYAEVSARIVAELERGAAPWIKPWSATAGQDVPCNAVTNRPYSGCNVVPLWMAQQDGFRAPRYLTFKQALELGGHVRKGEHGTKVYFVKQLQAKDADDETKTRIVPNMTLKSDTLRQCIGRATGASSGSIKIHESCDRPPCY